MKKLLLLFCISSSLITNAQPSSWKVTGIGGGGAFFRPSVNPGNANEYYVPTDMGPLFHTTDFGNTYSELSFRQLIGGSTGLVRFTNDPKILYAIGTNPAVDKWFCTVYKSVDGGLSWQMPNGIKNPVSPELGNGNNALSLWVNYNNPNQLVVSTHTGLFYSNDGAATFMDLKTQITYQSGISIYSCGCFFEGNNIYVGTNQGVLVSTNSGTTWTKPTLTGIPAGEDIFGFAAAKQGSTVRFFCITGAVNGVMNPEDIQLAAGGTYNLLKGVYSLDYNNSNAWVSKINGITMPHNDCYPCDHMNWIGMAENDINKVYLYGGNGNSEPTVLKTTDAGSNWNHVFMITNNQNIYSGYMGYKGDPFQWYLGNAGMSVCASNADVVVLANMGCVYKTANGATTWEQGYVNPADQNAMGIATPKYKPYRGVGIENTTNWFVHWSNANDVLGCLTDIGSIRSTDGGNYWQFTHFSFNTMYCAVEHPTTHTIYCGASDKHDMYSSTALWDGSIDDPSYSNGKLLASTDKGDSWTVIHDFTRPVYFLALDPNNSNKMYVSVVNHKQGLGGIWVTSDLQNGASSSWTQLPAPPRTEGHPAAIVPLKDGKVVCTFSGRMTDYNATPAGKFTRSSGVFIYDPGNNTWSDMTELSTMGWYCNDIYVDPNDSKQNTWYAGVSSGWGWTDASGNVTPNDQGGLFKTTDRGQTWKKLFGTSDKISPGSGIFSCTINPSNPNQMYATSTSDGVLICNNINDPSPVFSQVTSFQFGNPIRVFFNPYNNHEIWVTTFGNGIHIGNDLSTGIADFGAKEKVELYPNPATNECTVNMKSLKEKNVLQVHNLLGEAMLNVSIDGQTEKYIINTSLWPQGIYVISLNSTIVNKLVVQE